MSAVVGRRRTGEDTDVDALKNRVAEWRRLVRTLKAARYPSLHRIANAEGQLAQRIEMLATAKKAGSAA